MILETNRLVIRPVGESDEKPFVLMAADGSLNDIGFDRDCGERMGEWIREAKELAKTDDPLADYLAYTVVLKESGEAIGSVGCSYYDDLDKVGVTYFIGARHRGGGYAAEAVKAYAEYFLSHYDIPELIATVREDNTASWRTVEKAGFALVEKRLYKDINDSKEEMYRFYARN